jgi:hypothetical protein
MKSALSKLKKIANLKGQFRTEHKSVVASKKTGSSPILCIFPLDSGANFLEQNRKVTFRHPDEIPESWTIPYM